MLPRFHPRHLLRRWPERRPFDPSLVAYYSGVLGSGSVLYDESIYGNHGTIYGATWAEGKIRPALSFDGVDDYVNILHSASLSLPSEFSVAAWIKISSFPTYGIIAEKGWWGSNPKWFLHVTAAGQLVFDVWTADPRSEAFCTIQANAWYHIVATIKSGEKVKLYVNVMLYEGDNVVSGDLSNTRNVGIGALSYLGPANFFNGIIDEVRIYNRALSAAEVLREYLRLA